MNVEVRVGSINVGFKATMVEPTLATTIRVSVEIPVSHTHQVSTVISINGHSLSAVNPDVALIGGEATLAMA